MYKYVKLVDCDSFTHTPSYSLADHYPETLGTAFVINLPTVVTWMFKIISPLLDPVTREKVGLQLRVRQL